MTMTTLFRQPRFYRLALTAAGFGTLIGGLTALFWIVLYAGIAFVWETIPATLGIAPHPWWYTVLIVLGGSALVGLCQRYLGDYPQEMSIEIAAFREHGRFDTDHIPHGMFTSFVSLAAGASLGPDAPLVGLGGGLTSLAGDRLRQLGGGDGSPLWTKSVRQVLLVISLLAGGIAFVVIARAGGMIGEGGFFDATGYTFSWEHLLWTVPAALIGILGGYLYLGSDRLLHHRLTAWHSQPVQRAMFGGLVFAAIAAVLPLTLFSGQHSLPELQTQARAMSGVLLLLSGILKIMVVALLFNTGWKGGTLLPLMTGAAMLGVVFSQFVPGLPALVPMVAAMTGVAAMTLGQPLIVMVLMLLLAPLSTVGVYVTALVVSVVAGRLVQRLSVQMRLRRGEVVEAAT
jgi:H+/Cl- antiporter ClcA